MGQVQSTPAAEDQSNPTTTSTTTPVEISARSSLDYSIAQAVEYGDEDDNDSLEVKAQKALECPCIDHLRSSPCGAQFSDAFVCFLKSTAEEKGSDCVHPFVALQNCIKANPNAFPNDILGDEDIKKEEKPSPKYKIRPPLWAGESKAPNRQP